MKSPAHEAVSRLLATVGTWGAEGAAACTPPDATYANMPHPPVRGPEGVRGLLAPIPDRCEHVERESVTVSFAANRAWMERADRFRVDAREYTIECNGVVEVDPPTGLITAFPDYVDLDAWGTRLGGVLPR